MANNFVSNANATDLMNAINQKKDTKPDTITWAEWIQLTDQEREGTHYIITNVPAQFSLNDAIFSMKNRTLVFTNKTCTINDDRITADTYVLTFYDDEAVAQAAGIDCTWTTGSITFTVVDNPVSNIILDILFINPALSPGGGSGEGGHVIENQSGTDMTQRANMQFVDSQVSDDSTNDRTKIEVIKRVTKAQLEALGANTDGIYEVTDEEDEPWVDPEEDYVEVTADGDKTWTTLLNEVYALVNSDKVNYGSYLIADGHCFRLIAGGTAMYFDAMNNLPSGAYNLCIKLSLNSTYDVWNMKTSGNEYSSNSSNKPTNGTKITLYYGNKSSIVELNTNAQHCIMSDGETNVEEAIEGLSVPRMKNWGTFTTQAQLETFLAEHEVSTGKFTGLRVGDYFTLAGYTCYIAGFDTEYKKGNTALTTHHITFIANFGNSQMNENNTTAGGYEGATTMQTFLSGKETELNAICSSHLLSRKVLTTDAVTDGKSSNWAWNTHKLTLMSETQIYGSIQWGNVFDTGEGYEKLPVFNCLTPLQLFESADVWLRGVASATNFCLSYRSGSPDNANASSNRTTCALFCVG